jgi:hypothetical protein
MGDCVTVVTIAGQRSQALGEGADRDGLHAELVSVGVGVREERGSDPGIHVVTVDADLDTVPVCVGGWRVCAVAPDEGEEQDPRTQRHTVSVRSAASVAASGPVLP